MELSYLRYFRAVAQCEHISRAAEELHITQPALSRAISRMEQEVGAQLFVREANRIHLNHAGRVMLFRVEQILAQYDDAMREIKDSTQADSGAVMVLSASEDLVSDCFCRYMLEHPNIQLFHRIVGAEETVHLLAKHGADFALTPEIRDAAQILWKPLVREKYILAVSRDNPLAAAGTVDLTDLAEEYFIFTQGGTVFDTKLRECCLSLGFDPKVRFKGVNSDLPWALLRHNQGVMFLPASARCWKYNSFLEANRDSLAFLDIGNADCHRTIGIATLRGGYLNNASLAAMRGVFQYYETLRGLPGIEVF